MPEVLEKPKNKEDQLRMLLDLNGGMCEVVTGVSVGMRIIFTLNTQLSHRCPLS